MNKPTSKARLFTVDETEIHLVTATGKEYKLQISNDTEIKLMTALTDLINREPKNTKPDGKINLKRINDETKLTQGHVYYYKGFVGLAKKVIEDVKKDVAVDEDDLATNSIDPPSISQLKKQKQKQEELKLRYRRERDDFKQIADELVRENVCLAFRVLELEDENRHLTDPSGKVIALKDTKRLTDSERENRILKKTLNKLKGDE